MQAQNPFRLRSLIYAIGLLALIGAPQAQAQQVQEVTFEEALQIALRNNPQLQRGATAVRGQAEAVELARAAFLPDLSASVQPMRRFGLAFDQTTGSLQQESSDALSASLSTNVNVFNGFRDVADVQRRRLEQEAGTLSLDRTREVVLFSVAAQFLAVVLDRELVSIRQEALATQQAQLQRIRDLVEGGVRPRADLLQQEALVAEAELAVLQAESQLELAETELVRLLQLDPRATYDFVAPPLEEADAVPRPYDLGRLTSTAFDRRSDLRAQDVQIDAAEAGVRVARGGYYPRVNLFASFGSSYSSLGLRPIPGTITELPVLTQSGEPIFLGDEPVTFQVGPAFERVPFGDQFFTDNRGGSIGFSVQVPIFDRFMTRSQVRQAQLIVENERIARAELEQNIAVEVRQAYLDYRNSEKRLDVTARQVAAARAALDAEEDRYEMGVSTLVELAQARSRVVEAESARAQAIAQFIFQSRRLEYSAGMFDPATDLFD